MYGHSGLNAPSFKKAVPAVGPPVYGLQDEEIDFDKVVKEEEIPVPRAVSWTGELGRGSKPTLASILT